MRDLPFDAAPVGFATSRWTSGQWRIYTKIGDAGGFIRAAERYDSRREIVRDLLLQNLLPLALGMPVLALPDAMGGAQGICSRSPTRRTRIDMRSPEETGPLDAHDAPEEIAPLIGAINGLLQRLRRVLDNERAVHIERGA